jgi:hypothetical protein
MNIISTIITSLTTVIVALIPLIVSVAKGKSLQKNALLMLLQSQLTEIYYKYESARAIPNYRYKNWKNLLSVYESLGGDDYIHDLDKRMTSWNILQDE